MASDLHHEYSAGFGDGREFGEEIKALMQIGFFISVLFAELLLDLIFTKTCFET